MIIVVIVKDRLGEVVLIGPYGMFGKIELSMIGMLIGVTVACVILE